MAEDWDAMSGVQHPARAIRPKPTHRCQQGDEWNPTLRMPRDYRAGGNRWTRLRGPPVMPSGLSAEGHEELQQQQPFHDTQAPLWLGGTCDHGADVSLCVCVLCSVMLTLSWCDDVLSLLLCDDV